MRTTVKIQCPVCEKNLAPLLASEYATELYWRLCRECNIRWRVKVTPTATKLFTLFEVDFLIKASYDPRPRFAITRDGTTHEVTADDREDAYLMFRACWSDTTLDDVVELDTAATIT